MSNSSKPLKTRWEVVVAAFVLAGAAATLFFAAGTSWFGNREPAIAGLRFRFAPPPARNGAGGYNTLTINLDHSGG